LKKKKASENLKVILKRLKENPLRLVDMDISIYKEKGEKEN